MGNVYNKFFSGYYKIRFLLIALWVVLVVLGCVFGFRFLKNTTLELNPPPGTEAKEAEAEFSKHFPGTVESSQFVFLFKATKDLDGPSVYDNDWLLNASNQIINFSYSYPRNPSLVVDIKGRYTWSESILKRDPVALRVAKKFVSSSNRSSVMLVATRNQGEFKFIKYMKKRIADEINMCNGNYSIYMMGLDTVVQDMTDGIISDLKTMDSIAMPIALIVLVCVVQSITMLIIPIIAVATSALVGFLIMTPISYVMTLPSFCPPLMMSINVAMSIDYCLFILTRYREELNKGRNIKDAMKYTLKYSGGTILTSGSVLCGCLLSLTFFPQEIIVSIGLSIVVAVIVTVSVALTFIPPIMCVFGKFFSIHGVIPCVKKCREVKVYSRREQVERDTKKFWYKLTDWTTKKYNFIILIVIVLVCLAPFAIMNIKMDVVYGVDQLLPRNSPSAYGIKEFMKEWPVGLLSAFQVMAVPKSPNATIFTKDYFKVNHNMCAEIYNSSEFGDGMVFSVGYANGKNITYTTAKTLLTANETAYSYLNQLTVSKDKRAAITMAFVGFNPLLDTRSGTNFIRRIAHKYTKETDYTFYVSGLIVATTDIIWTALHYFPYIILCTFVILYLVISVVFKAAFLPVRMVLTLCVTVVTTYGIIAIIFCTKAFYWLFPSIKEQPGFGWAVFILSFSMLVGLGLDYDIFLFTRVVEYRKLGWSNKAAIVKGVAKTGSVISFAGVIMAIAFIGLATSNVMLINQFGVLLALGVLLDTFVIRSMLSPALIYAFGFVNYWPMRPKELYFDPAVYYPSGELEDDEEVDHSKGNNEGVINESEDTDPLLP